eukprot:UN03544
MIINTIIPYHPNHNNNNNQMFTTSFCLSQPSIFTISQDILVNESSTATTTTSTKIYYNIYNSI